MAETAEFDVAIVGGRVAGASLALLLARQGRRVAMVDRDAFPSDTLSTHFMAPLAVMQLGQLGVLSDVLAAGFRPIVRHRTYVEDCLLEGPAGPPGAFSLSPRRSVLDPLIVEHAVRAGVTFSGRTRAERLIERDGRVAGIVVSSAGSEMREIRARVVVGADGKHSKVAELVRAESYDAVPAMRPMYYGYFHGLVPLPEATTELFCGGGQIGFVFPMRPDEDCIALELQPGDFDDMRRDPKRGFDERVSALPGMAKRFASARLEGKLMGAKGIDNYFRVPFGPGWALTGDAGYLKDPSTGLGMGDALAQAFMLADALGAYFDGADWDAAMTAFHRRRDERMKPLYEATLAFTRMRDPSPGQADRLRAICMLPPVARRILSKLPRHFTSMVSPATAARVESLVPQFHAARERDAGAARERETHAVSI
jgi:2-polyprenyl-6-methoxyphenol hydroxylase-like FAD-dependent oxidoreductase